MNYGHLYKYKKIHHIYKAVDNIWHIEAYPIIYMNDTYVYFSVPGSTKLECKARDFYENGWEFKFDEAAKDKLSRRFAHHESWSDFSFNGGYYLDVDVEDAKRFCKSLSKSESCASIITEIENCKKWLNRYEHFEKDIQDKRQRLNDLEEELKTTLACREMADFLNELLCKGVGNLVDYIACTERSNQE